MKIQSLIVTLLILSAPAVYADVTLAPIFGDNMVLQREMSVPIWGTGRSGEKVTVKLGSEEVQTSVDHYGKWTAKLAAKPAGGPYAMEISGKNKIVLKNIYFGEVWLCSGQSNMGFTIRSLSEAKKPHFEPANIRVFTVQKVIAGQKRTPFQGSWVEASPETINDFSALAYFFGQNLYQHLHVPIGLIDSSLGGSSIELWIEPTSYKLLKKHQHHKHWFKDAIASIMPNEEVTLDDLQKPSYLYQQMMDPMVKFALRGVLWYQGEADVGVDSLEYFKYMKALIEGWRQTWQQGNFPFYYVQLPPYNYNLPNQKGRLPLLWQAQLQALSIQNTGMVVTNDCSELDNLHPQNKYYVANRLANLALAKTYNFKDVAFSSPLYQEGKIKGSKVFLKFSNVGVGLRTRDQKPPSWFEIAGLDGQYLSATAKIIDSDTIVVFNNKVIKPVAVRFAWSQVAQPNLENKAGLPVPAFLADKLLADS